jgi:glycosyltransferase involved in cell wall biosynthesis
MKICIVSFNIVALYNRSNDSQYGGAEVQTAVLADAFAAAGADVCLVVRDLDKGADPPYPAYNAYNYARGIPGLSFFYRTMPGVLSSLSRADADLYFQHCAGVETGLTAWHCRRRGKAFVYFAGSDTDFSYREARLANPRDRAIFHWGLKNATRVVAQNEHQAQRCREGLGIDPAVIPTAVALADHNSTDKDGSVVWVGALREVKRPKLFVDLARSMPDRRFVLIGGETMEQPEIAAGVREAAKSAPNVTLTGHLTRAEVDAYMERAALLVNTSRVEGFPNAFLEAWKNRTPVVSFVDVDGLIGSEGVGLVCGDTGEMSGVIARLLDDDDRRGVMGERARRLVEERYSAAALARRYMAVFDEALGAVR